jgi:ABC-type uncharacterized transport system substrate-binding protein
LINPANDNAENQLKDVAQGTLALHRPAVTLKASNESEINAAFDAFSQQNVNAVLVASDPFFYGRRNKIVELAARYNLPSIYEWREFVQAGGLASYGSNLSDNYRLGGVYVGRVLGANVRLCPKLTCPSRTVMSVLAETNSSCADRRLRSRR